MIQLRRAKPQDLERVLDWIERYYAFDHIPFDREKIRPGLELLLSTPAYGAAWLIVADDSGEAGEVEAGYVILGHGFDLENGGRQGTITDLYVGERYRGRGFGRQALEAIFAHARAEGLLALELAPETRNAAARRLYEKAGFVAHARVPMRKTI